MILRYASFTTIDFNWNDKSGRLTIGARSGQYEGMIQNRQFRVVLIRDGVEKPAKTVRYTGKKVSVKL